MGDLIEQKKIISAEQTEQVIIKALVDCMIKHKGLHETSDAVLDALHNIPAADAVPVVRCECCVYGEQYKRMDGENGYYCKHPENEFEYWQNQKKFTPTKGKNDFCSFGKQRKDEK